MYSLVEISWESTFSFLIISVEMSVAEETGEGLFVCFVGVMKKLHNMKAYEAGHLLAGDGANPEETEVPPFVKDMEGKTYKFQVRVSAYNFTANQSSDLHHLPHNQRG
ncbi:uncharacterized protein LOC130507878 isoform X2 [Raphanus sativus]|uniref:Uncharacterized protein LOC130507878 isoform X2 n=1 Tax=Raphanus sativus TaxID=3726 RepID=A0A9W3D482_RAPSA|nr:uncharacterized protein LOC130507878 isoform X2 [Raphanus sativus]XP_056858557.1 uncharacterized protein LOC130507878 isoform X2 [Raphanus sativus]